MTIKNFYNVSPDEVEPGDVFICTIAVHITYKSATNKLFARAYRCPYPDLELSQDGIPQGSAIDREATKQMIKNVMPVLSWAGVVPE